MKESQKQLVIELVDQQSSGYFLDGGDPEKMEVPNEITCPSYRKILSTSVVVENGEYRKIRYIKGYKSIYVDEQDKAGIKPNTRTDVIWIKDGKEIVFSGGADPAKYEFLKKHAGNTSNPNRPPGADPIFREIDTELDAQADEEVEDLDFQARQYLQTLKKKVGKVVTYNEDAIQFLASLFKLPHYDSGYKSEAWVELTRRAKQDPRFFLTTIASKRSIVESEVNQAIETGVITLDQVRAVFSGTSKVICSFPAGTTKSERVDVVIDFMANPENHLSYDEMRTELHAKKVALTDELT